ncbi:Filamentation induced by cAMP/death on curing, related protein [Riemerella anatipestifer RA-GD]|uniref:Fic family protein n=1 Tax=Riemerella anatipestifer TaxID=34085 RepID=UPI0002011194|nr:Fic/DOC family N-terminal domain-containing protein [Riemerella anatipestifer]ADZ12221.1 Filamentation induced by cAMP/death on curing, related protein [Riemerella anatipestifer RA-GD]
MDYKIDSAVEYHYNQFPPKNIDYPTIIDSLIKATDALARYDQMLKNLYNTEILLTPLRNQEAVISSRIEGTISTIDEILQYEADYDDTDQPNIKSDVIETILYQRCLKNSQKAMEDGYPLSPNFIRQMHQQLLYLGRGADKSPGEFKKEQNFLADKIRKEIQFIPISPEKLTDGLELLFEFIENDHFPPLIKTAISHLEFEALHPFKDGNGRIGRMLITLLLWKEGVLSQPHFYISGYFETHKDEYIYQMRNVSQTHQWEQWIQFFLQAVESQAIKNLQIAEKIKTLYEETKISLAGILSSKWNIQLVDFIFTNPVFRTNRFVKETQIPNATASGIIKKLLENDYIITKEAAAGSRSALYSFEPMMRLVRV